LIGCCFSQITAGSAGQKNSPLNPGWFRGLEMVIPENDVAV